MQAPRQSGTATLSFCSECAFHEAALTIHRTYLVPAPGAGSRSSCTAANAGHGVHPKVICGLTQMHNLIDLRVPGAYIIDS